MRRLLLVLLLAGCAAPADDLATEPMAVVEGVVVNPTLKPIEFATVRLGAMERITDEEGVFRFTGVNPGAHLVSVAAEGYMPAETTTQADTFTQVQLMRDVQPQPYYSTHKFDAFVDVWGGPASTLTSTVGTCLCAFDVRADGIPETVVVEAFWDNRIYTNQVKPTEYTASIGALSHTEDNPLLWHVPGSEIGKSTFEVQVVPDAVIPALNQDYSIFVTTFHGAPAPQGWRVAEVL